MATAEHKNTESWGGGNKKNLKNDYHNNGITSED
jgi:hypothetical protein